MLIDGYVQSTDSVAGEGQPSTVRMGKTRSIATQDAHGRYYDSSTMRFAVRRIIGGGDLWITEFILTYDGKPSYTVSIMEFRDDVHTTRSASTISAKLRKDNVEFFKRQPQ